MALEFIIGVKFMSLLVYTLTTIIDVLIKNRLCSADPSNDMHYDVQHVSISDTGTYSYVQSLAFFQIIIGVHVIVVPNVCVCPNVSLRTDNIHKVVTEKQMVREHAQYITAL